MPLSRLLATLALILLAGCAKPPTWSGEGLPLSRTVGTSVEGRPIPLYELGTGPDVVLVIATIHGNENAGTPLCDDLIPFLAANPDLLEGRKVVFLPVANPDGYAADKRFNANGVDLNRNFEAANRLETRRSGDIPLSEPESRAIKAVLEEFKPARIVSMHEPLDVIDWDGPGEPLARHMGRFATLPVRRLGSRAGSLGSYAGEDLGIPIITLEFPRGAGNRPPEDLWKDYARPLLAAITYPADPPEL
jgi:protein MpaA